MAARYWVGGTAAWDGTAGTKWALTSGGAGGQAVPTNAEDVFFDAASGAVTITQSGARECLSIDMTGFTGTFTGSSAGLGVSGNVTFGSGCTLAGGAAVALETLATCSITSNGKTWPGALFMATAAITVTLQGALSCDSLDIQRGTFNANNYNVTLANGSTPFNSSYSTARTITMGSGTWTMTGANALCTVSNSANLTLTANTSTLKFTGTSGSKTLSLGGKTLNDVWLSGAGTLNIVPGSGGTLSDLKIDGAGRAISVTAGSTIILSSITQANGGAIGDMQVLRSSITGTTATINKTSGSPNMTFVTLQDLTFGGGATWTATNSIDVDNNSGITITPPSSGGGGFSFGSWVQ